MQSTQATLPIGILLKGRYLVLDLLSKSNSGTLYLVEDQRIKNKSNALFAFQEVINPSKYKLKQIAIEGMSLRLLNHHALPKVYTVISMGEQERVYIPLDYIEGPNLEIVSLRQPEKRFSLPLAIAIMDPIMEAVTYLHSQQSLTNLSPIVHQNIKPANIIISSDFPRKRTHKVVLVGFGIGKQSNLNSINGVNLCSTTSYEAPEQYSGEITTSSDIYGLGATFYSLLTGIVPTDALSRTSKSSDPLKSVNQLVPGVSTLVAECINRAMSLSCYDRFPTVNDFHQALKGDPAWQQSRKLNLPSELDLALKGDSVRQLISECRARLSMEEQLPPSEGAAANSEDQQVPGIASSTLIDRQLLASNNVPSDTIQQDAVSDVTPFIPIEQQVSVPDVDFLTQSQPRADTVEEESAAPLPMVSPPEDQPLTVAEAGLPDIPDQLLPEPIVTISKTLDQQHLGSVNVPHTLDEQQVSVNALNGKELLTPGSLTPPQTSQYDYSVLWPHVNIEMSFSQSGCEWFVTTQEQQNNNRRDTT
jgi:serine/threonine protein kinase